MSINIEYIKETVRASRQQAERIMDGGENYDGADGAREVLMLCDVINYLLKEGTYGNDDK